MPKTPFDALLDDVRSCTLCADDLALGARPVLQLHANARVLIAGQAPGVKVHTTGIPFDDPSGKRLRQWMGITSADFYDATKVAILPMGFCYPGKGASGDLPPRAICDETWREKLLEKLPNIKLTLLIGQYAQAWHLENREKNLTETVRNWRNYASGIIPLPHPSPRNNIWLKKNPWFDETLVPEFRKRTTDALAK